eukprot:TRINITY_DN1107_c0_g1_i3.p1 TRINITY_DN1107_c0_g1~~TRINITY_DN1107_c0_g1_i3.p1  ORF type:complete len:652 (-),score=154.18 TRINITY_DN1107_c0_g1_i3:131-2059(-)
MDANAMVAAPQAMASGPPSEKLFVRGLPVDANEETIRFIFSQYGQVASLKLNPVPPGKTDASALIILTNLPEARWCVDNLNGNIPQGLPTPVQVIFATPELMPGAPASHLQGDWYCPGQGAAAADFNQGPGGGTGMQGGGMGMQDGGMGYSGMGVQDGGMGMDGGMAVQQYQGPPATPEEVESFLMNNPVDQHAADQLRQLPPHQQKMVIARGSLDGVRDRTASLIGRMKNVVQGLPLVRGGEWICPGCGDHQFSRNQFCRKCRTPNPSAPPPEPMEPAVQAFLNANPELLPHVLDQFRLKSKDVQKLVVSKGSLKSARDKTAAFIGRIKNCERMIASGEVDPSTIVLNSWPGSGGDGGWGAPQILQGPAASPEEVEAFLAQNPEIELHAQDQFRGKAPFVQKLVLARGSLASARDKTGAFIGRMTQCEKVAKGQVDGMSPGDWICMNCGDHQFARNTTCRGCGAANPNPNPLAGKGGGKGWSDGGFDDEEWWDNIAAIASKVVNMLSGKGDGGKGDGGKGKDKGWGKDGGDDMGKGWGKDGGGEMGKGWGKDGGKDGGGDMGKGWGKDGGGEMGKGWGKDGGKDGGDAMGKGWGKDGGGEMGKGWGKDGGEMGKGWGKDGGADMLKGKGKGGYDDGWYSPY